MMKLLPVAFLSLLPLTQAADDAGAKPGFFERVWRSTKDGAGRTVEATRRIGGKAAEAARSPFQRGEKKNSDGGAGWRRLAMTMRLEPPVVKADETRAIEIVVGVVNNGKDSVQLDFPTSQRIEVLVKDEKGSVLSRWSDDQRVDKEPGFILINPGERIQYTAKISTRDMKAGKSFTIEAYFPGYDRLRTSRTVVPRG